MFRSSVWLGQIKSFHDFPMIFLVQGSQIFVPSKNPRLALELPWSKYQDTSLGAGINDPRLHFFAICNTEKSAARKPLITLSAGLYLPHLQDLQWWNAWKFGKRHPGSRHKRPTSSYMDSSSICQMLNLHFHLSHKLEELRKTARWLK